MLRFSKVIRRKGPKPQPRKFQWNGHHAKPKDCPSRTLDEFYNLSIGDANKGPIAFTAPIPGPLQGFDMSTVELANGKLANVAAIDQQTPSAIISPERMGLHAFLVDKMRSAFGMKLLTPIQARVLQCMYARYDICSCAPTGSGKTLAICVGLVARLMRDGPPKQGSTVFLVPTEELGYQIERWLRALWWYSEDEDSMFLSHCVSREAVEHAYTIGPSDEDIAVVGDQRLVLPRISRNMRYPENNPYILLTTPEVFWEWLQHSAPLEEKGINKKLFPQIDTIVVDEVESILKVQANIPDKECPGHKVLQQLYACKPFETPINVLLNSATLAPTTMNHVRQFLNKNIFDPTTVQMFANTNERGEYVTGQEQSGIAKQLQDIDPSKRDPGGHLYRSLGDAALFTQMRYKLPESIAVSFYLLTGASSARDDQLQEILKSIRVMLRGAHRSKKSLIIAESDLSERYIIHMLQSSHALHGQGVEIQKFRGAAESQPDGAACGPKGMCAGSTQGHIDTQHAGAQDSRDNEPASNVNQTIIVSSARRIKGIDFPGLEVVFITFTPKNVMDFVHFAGRVGRMGSCGTCVVLIPPASCRPMREQCSVLNIPFSIENEADFT